MSIKSGLSWLRTSYNHRQGSNSIVDPRERSAYLGKRSRALLGQDVAPATLLRLGWDGAGHDDLHWLHRANRTHNRDTVDNDVSKVVKQLQADVRFDSNTDRPSPMPHAQPYLAQLVGSHSAPTRLARLRRNGNSISSGCSSIKRVVAVPAKKPGWRRTLSKKGMLVLTPRMRDSTRARVSLLAAAAKVLSVPVI